MKNFLLPLFLLLLLTDTILPQVFAPSQGEVVINAFDPRWQGGRRAELVELVNKTNKHISLDGYILQSFGEGGEDEKYGYYEFSSSDIMPPFSFLLISNIAESSLGVEPDLVWNGFVTGDLEWPDDGYIALRKIVLSDPPNESDYLDIIKHRDTNPTFDTDVPAGSGLLSNTPAFLLTNVPIGTLIGTRGGISGDINSCNYTGYLNFIEDFTAVSETTIQLHNSLSAPLPVELSSFSAVVLKTGVKLNWKTETEVNNYGFEIERKAGSLQSSVGNYEKMGFVNGSGNSNSPKNYSYHDMNVTSGKYSYRLKQIDSDGKFEYSKAIEVNLNGPGKFELSQNYPNPFNPTTTIRFSIPEAGNVKLTLYNILAQEIKVLVNESKEAGVHTVNFSASDLNSGLYIYKLEANGLTQTRKMTLVK